MTIRFQDFTLKGSLYPLRGGTDEKDWACSSGGVQKPCVYYGLPDSRISLTKPPIVEREEKIS